MTIAEIYQKYFVPPNLQEHMLRVHGIVLFLKQHWRDKEKVKLDWSLLEKAALLHDLGNLVKFDLEKHSEFLLSEQMNLPHWKSKQQELLKRYGTDDHEATKKMFSEIKLDQKIQQIVLEKSFKNSVLTYNSSNWPLKILYYADLRTLPWGIGTLTERVADIKERMPQYTSRADFPQLIAACWKIEEQIQEQLDLAVQEISDEVIRIDKQVLKTKV